MFSSRVLSHNLSYIMTTFAEYTDSLVIRLVLVWFDFEIYLYTLHTELKALIFASTVELAHFKNIWLHSFFICVIPVMEGNQSN